MAPRLTPTIPGLICAGGQSRVNGRMSLARKAETVDHRLIGGEAKEARARIALLRQRRDRAYLGKTEAKAEDRIGNFAILVEARRKAKRIWEIETECLDREARVVGRRPVAAGLYEAP